MSSNGESNVKKFNTDPRGLTFIKDSKPKMVDGDVSALSDFEHERKLSELKKNAVFLYLPKDPAYKPISDDLLNANEMRGLDGATKVMINVALGDYCVFRRKSDDENTEEDSVKLNFKRVYFDEFDEYSETQDALNDYNKRILFLDSSNVTSLNQIDELREMKKQAKKAIDEKIRVGLETFFKIPKQGKGSDILEHFKIYDYNDLLLNIEIGVFRYTRAPFLRQIS